MTFRYGQKGFTDSVTLVWMPYDDVPSNEPGWTARDAEVAALNDTIAQLRAQLDGSAIPRDAELINRARRQAPEEFGSRAPRLDTQLADALAAAAWREKQLRDQIDASPEAKAEAAARLKHLRWLDESGHSDF